jgi:hypothetical protein
MFDCIICQFMCVSQLTRNLPYRLVYHLYLSQSKIKEFSRLRLGLQSMGLAQNDLLLLLMI